MRSIQHACGARASGRWQERTAAAYHLLERQLPGHWVLQPLFARDYGLDCLLEIADDTGPLDGQSAWIQLHAERRINWNLGGQYRAGHFTPASQQYWRINHGPVFVFLADLTKESLYFQCAEFYVKRHFSTYLMKGRLSYWFDRLHHGFDQVQGPARFGLHLEQAATRRELENALTLFFTHLERQPAWPASGPAVAAMPSTHEVAPAYLRRVYAFLYAYFGLTSCCILDLLHCLAARLQEDLSYWALTNPALYYYVCTLTRQALHVYGQQPAPLPAAMLV